MKSSTPEEEAFIFECEGRALIGILHLPPANTNPSSISVGVVIIVGGPQYRVGSHRQFISLARKLAQNGYPVLRFDVRGMGDSNGTMNGFENVSPDINAAINQLLHRQRQLRRVVLWGLCDGASAALLYLKSSIDARVAGLCLVNPWIRTETTLAITHFKYYYAQRLTQVDFWRKLLSGKIAVQAFHDLHRSFQLLIPRQNPSARLISKEAFPERMTKAAESFKGFLLIVISERDFTAKEFSEYTKTSGRWLKVISRSKTTKVEIRYADHTFSTESSQRTLEELVVEWLPIVATPDCSLV